jgi:hypothetical protein
VIDGASVAVGNIVGAGDPIDLGGEPGSTNFAQPANSISSITSKIIFCCMGSPQE